MRVASFGRCAVFKGRRNLPPQGFLDKGYDDGSNNGKTTAPTAGGRALRIEGSRTAATSRKRERIATRVHCVAGALGDPSTSRLFESVHPSFTSRVVRQAVTGPSVGAVGLGRSTPLWTRATAAVALAGGILVGALLVSPSESEDWTAWDAVELTQAEVYWETMSVSSDDLVQEDLP